MDTTMAEEEGGLKHHEEAVSALRVFAAEFEDHAHQGRCAGCERPPVLPLPAGYMELAA